MDTSDEWIRKRTGIERRHIVDPTAEGDRSRSPAMRCAQAIDAPASQASDIDLLIMRR